MRKTFAEELYKHMKENKDIWVVTGDLGYGMWDKIREDFPERFVNAGASEQAMMGIAVGLALKGKIPFVYSITNFLIYRPFETIKLYLDGERIPVKLVGSGRDKDYAHDGPSHDMTDIPKVMETLPNIVEFWPKDTKSIKQIVENMIVNNEPSFISLKR